MSSHRKDTFYNLLGAGLPLALSLLTIPLYLNSVGLERLGVLQISWVFLGYFGVLDLGIGKATAYFLAQQREDAEASRRTFYTSLTMSLVVGAVVGTVFFLIAWLFFGHVFQVSGAVRAEMMPVLPFLAAAVPVGVLMSNMTSTLQGRGRFLAMNTLTLSSTALFQLFPLALAFLVSPSLSLLIPAAILSRVAGMVAAALVCAREIGRPGLGVVNRDSFRTLLGYGGWASVSSLLAPIIQLADRMAIGAVLGATAVASYMIPLQFAQRMSILPSSVSLAMFPKLVAATPEARRAMTDEGMTMIGAVLLALLAVALPLMPEFLRLWLQSHYQPEIGRVAIILFTGYFFNGVAIFSVVQLQSSGQPRRIAETYAIQIPVYFALLFGLMHVWGVVGAAAALALRFVMDLTLLTLFANRRLPPRALMVQAVGLLAVAGSVMFAPRTATGVAWMLAGSATALGAAAATMPRSARNQLQQLLARFGLRPAAAR